jgi:nuclear transport factor 2 (NTF2) superfamily protein
MKTLEQRNPLPPFSNSDAILKVRLAENAWNNQNPSAIALAYSLDSRWRNRRDFVTGRDDIIALLTNKWKKENEYRLIKELWAYTDNRIAVRFAYEWRDKHNNWFRSYGNENWAFDENGLMKERHASINDLPIDYSQRKFLWPMGTRPEDHPSLSDLGL